MLHDFMTTLKITTNNLIPGVCSMDVAKLAPTDDLQTFIDNFCTNNTLTVQERCFFVRTDDVIINNSKRPYMDVEMSLKYVGVSASKVGPDEY